MDLSDTYKNIIRKHLPSALIIADRFHVIKLVNHHFLKTRNLLDPIGRKNRGLLSLMRRNDGSLMELLKYQEELMDLETLKTIGYKSELYVVGGWVAPGFWRRTEDP